MDDVETIEALDRAERRHRRAWFVLALLLAIVVVAYLFVPRTLASGEIAGDAWRLRVAPLSFGDEATLTGPAIDHLERAQVGRTGGLDRTVVWWIGDPQRDTIGDVPAEPGVTLVVGPTPAGVDSVRITSDRGVGEARVERVGWRRYHVGQLGGHARISELVAIDDVGRPLEVADLDGGTDSSG